MSPRGAMGLGFALYRAYKQAKRQVEAERRRQERAIKKEKQLLYIEKQIQKVNQLNEALNAKIKQLQTLLDHPVRINGKTFFDSLRIKEEFPAFNPPQDLLMPNPAPKKEEFFSSVKPPGFLNRLIPGSKNRYEQKLLRAEEEYNEAFKKYETLEQERILRLQKLKEDYEIEKQTFFLKKERTNAEVDNFECAYQKGEPKAIIDYNSKVLQNSTYPKEFPKRFQLSYSFNSKEIVIEYELPFIEIVPLISEYKYIKTRDTIGEKKRKITEIKAIYLDVISSVALRTIYEIFFADQYNHVQNVIFNGYVRKIDPIIQQERLIYFISLSMPKDFFKEINFHQVESHYILKALKARISPNPIKLVPIKPFKQILT